MFETPIQSDSTNDVSLRWDYRFKSRYFTILFSGEEVTQFSFKFATKTPNCSQLIACARDRRCYRCAHYQQQAKYQQSANEIAKQIRRRGWSSGKQELKYKQTKKQAKVAASCFPRLSNHRLNCNFFTCFVQTNCISFLHIVCRNS